MIDELRPLLKKFIVFAKDNLSFKRPPRLFLKQDTANQKCMLGKTAHYDPQKMAITLYVSGRHPKDILRSFSHELVHHCQNERGDLAPEKMKTMNKNYAQENDHMRKMEKEAYLMGNMCFRDWEDGLDDKLQYKMQIAEQKFLKENKNMSVKLKRKDLKGLIEKLLESRSPKGNINEDPATKAKTLDFEKGLTIKAKPTRLPPEVEKAFEELKAELAKLGPAVSPEAMAALKKMATAAAEDTPVAGEKTSLQKEEILDEKGCAAHSRTDDNMSIAGPGKKCDKLGAKLCPEGTCNTCDDKRKSPMEEANKSSNNSNKSSNNSNHQGYGRDESSDKNKDSKKKPKPKPPKPEKKTKGKAEIKNPGEYMGGERQLAGIDDDGDGTPNKVDPDSKNGAISESKIQTPEQENTLYESRFTGRNTRLFEKLLKEWTK